MPNYTDQDVKRLVSRAQFLSNLPEFSRWFPDNARLLKKDLEPFEPDPWEKLSAYVGDRLGVLNTTPRDARKVIDKAVELGLVTKVGE